MSELIFSIRASEAFFVILKGIKRAARGVAFAKGSDVIFEGSFVFEIWATAAIPKLPTILFMGSPISFDSQSFATFSAHKWLGSMLSFVVGLEGSKVLQWLGSWMVDVVLAPLSAAITWQPQHCCWLCSSQGFWALSVLRSMPPHVHLNKIYHKSKPF